MSFALFSNLTDITSNMKDIRNKRVGVKETTELNCRIGSIVVTSQAGTSVCNGLFVRDTWGVASIVTNSNISFSLKTDTTVTVTNSTGKSFDVSVIY